MDSSEKNKNYKTVIGDTLLMHIAYYMSNKERLDNSLGQINKKSEEYNKHVLVVLNNFYTRLIPIKIFLK